MPEESKPVSTSPTTENNPSVLDKNVPNPLAKNPNVHTHKVFAAIGLILIGAIVILFGGAYIFGFNVADLFTSNQETDSTTKVSTSSSKPNVDETKDWKTYKAPGSFGEFKYRPDLAKAEDFGEGAYYQTFFVSHQTELDSDNNCINKTDCFLVTFEVLSYQDTDKESPYYIEPKDRYPYYDTINNLQIGTSTTQKSVIVETITVKLTREKDLKVNGITWLRYDEEIQNKSSNSTNLTYANVLIKKGDNVFHRFSLSSDGKTTVASQKELLEKIVSTFK